MAMPLGLGRLVALHLRGVAWAWGVNGVASVVASAGAITISIIWGFPIATLAAILCYLLARLYVRVQPWPEQGSAPLRGMGPVSEPQASSGALTS